MTEPNTNRQKHLAMAAIMGAATLWGSMGIFSRGIAAMDISVTSVAIIRNLGACILMGLFFLLTDSNGDPLPALPGYTENVSNKGAEENWTFRVSSQLPAENGDLFFTVTDQDTGIEYGPYRLQ